MKYEYDIGLIDADLLDHGTRHPNLTLMKIAGYCKDNNLRYRLITEDDIDTNLYEDIYISQVFTKTKLPEIDVELFKVHLGGTGLYATDKGEEFKDRRWYDMEALDLDSNLVTFNAAHQMPDYDLYNDYIAMMLAKGFKKSYFKDYLYYSIGFLTRGCIRHCPFCVNRYSNGVLEYSNVSDFLDENRPYIYLWDDNILAASDEVFNNAIQSLVDTNKPFQFRQGLDIRLVNDEKAKILTNCRYHGDYIFAFDNYKDRYIIEAGLNIWQKYCTKETKLYLFCGFHITTNNDTFYKDIIELFLRIEILMRYRCLGYVMRHADYTNHPLNNMYVQIARWVNQPQFYKKMSFEEYIYSQQKYIKGNITCKPIRTYEAFIELFKDRKANFLPLFRMKYL